MTGNSAERDRNAEFAAFTLPHLGSIVRVASALAGNAADADDLVQETFLRAYRHWHTFTLGTNCRRWLVTICRHALLEQRTRASRSTVADDEELESLAAAQLHNTAKAAGVDDMFDRLDLGPAIARAIDELESHYRQVVILVDVEGFAYEEVAESLDVPIGTVRSRLYRARRLLQAALIEYAIDAGYARTPDAARSPSGAGRK
ncbi:MAG: sigma-70 family RNA polymerase sigma factor [Gemmatimonadaceae bacterium]|nr:sigma-70 family RNA polymerase sigma factor [Gemmatimonadaceae bacterium]